MKKKIFLPLYISRLLDKVILCCRWLEEGSKLRNIGRGQKICSWCRWTDETSYPISPNSPILKPKDSIYSQGNSAPWLRAVLLVLSGAGLASWYTGTQPVTLQEFFSWGSEGGENPKCFKTNPSAVLWLSSPAPGCSGMDAAALWAPLWATA